MDRNPAVQPRSPLHELVLWLICIWTPVLFIYMTKERAAVRHSDSPSPSSPAVEKITIPRTQNEEGLTKELIPKRKTKAKLPNPDVPKADMRVQTPVTQRAEPSNSASENDSIVGEGTGEEVSATFTPQPESLIEASVPRHAVDTLALPAGAEPVLPKRHYRPPDNPYLAMVQRRISNEWHVPTIDQPMEAVVSFRLEKSGYISEVEIEQSSGNDYFDLAAKRAVLSSSPLPSFPEEMEGEFLNTHLKFSSESRKAP